MKTFLNVLGEIGKAVLRVLKISFLFFSIIIVLYVCRELFFHLRYIQQDDNSDPMNYGTYAYLIDINGKTIETKYNGNGGVDFILVSLVLTGYDNKNLKDIERTFFPSEDEKHILNTRYTQGLNYAMFSVPRSVGKFGFNAKLNYYSGESIDTFNLLGGPIVTIWPDTKQPNIPLVTLKADKSNVKVGEEVTFEVISDVFSHADDFEKERTIQIDFDGDGEYDLTTKNNRVKHSYSKASPTEAPYIPAASVIYRDYRGIGEGTPIIVSTGLKPQLMYSSVDKLVVFKDISVGNIIEREICFDKEQCANGNQKYLDTTLKPTFKFTYPQSGIYTVTMKVKDNKGNEASSEQSITITDDTTLKSIDDGLSFISLPEVEYESGNLSILLSKKLDYKAVFYVKSTKDITTCYVDSDLSFDSSGDGDTKNDKDFGCNKIENQAYTPNIEPVVGRIYYQKNGNSALQYKDFKVEFDDYEQNFGEETREKYDLIKELIQSIDDSSSITNGELRTLLVSMWNNIANGDKNALKLDVLQIEQLKVENKVKLSATQDEKLNDLINIIEDYATISAQGESVYEASKEEIISILPKELKLEVYEIFNAFEGLEGENSVNVRTKRAEYLNKIDEIISKQAVPSDNIGESEISIRDYENIVLPSICKIGKDYDISLTLCSDS